MTEAHPYLGVAKSLCGRFWLERPGDERLGLAISQRCQVPEIIGRMLAARGQSLEGAPGFLQPRLRDLLTDPSELKDMDQAAERLADAVARGERIAIFGDYDVDGATSAALLSRFLRAAGAAGAAALRAGPHARRLWPERGRLPCAEGRGRGPRHHGRLRHHLLRRAGRGQGHRARRHRRRPSRRRAGAAGGVRGGQSEPAGRELPASHPRRRRCRVPAGDRGQPRAAAARLVRPGAAGAGSAAMAGPGGAGNGVRRGAAGRLEPRAGGAGAEGDGAARQHRAQEPVRRGARDRPGRCLSTPPSCWGRASMPAGASGRSDLGARLLATEDPVLAGDLARQLDVYNEERRALETEVQEAATRQAEAQAADNPHLLFLAGARLASRCDRDRRRAPQGALSAPGLRHRAGERRGQGLRPLGRGAASRAGRDRGARGRAWC